MGSSDRRPPTRQILLLGHNDGFRLLRLGDPKDRLAVNAFHQLTPHFVWNPKELAASEVRTKKLNGHA